jgi:hypothetical protein
VRAAYRRGNSVSQAQAQPKLKISMRLSKKHITIQRTPVAGDAAIVQLTFAA